MLKFTRKVLKNNQGTYYVSIPKEIVKELKIKDGQKLDVSSKNKKIIIEDWKK